jgi:UDPglucose 6-dehydrogenase
MDLSTFKDFAMKIAVIGTGYVGLVTGTCFADSGNKVTCVDVDQAKIQRLKQGEIPIYEPGLAELVVRNAELGQLHFTTDFAAAVPEAQLVYLAVGTPSTADGSADLRYLLSAVDSIAPHLSNGAVVITKSTVPVGTCAQIEARLAGLTDRKIDVASNPEFLKEGAAIDDFMKPDRVVVGARRAEVGEILRELYAPFLRNENPFLVMSPESAELTKYVANAMLSTKISFINEMANICQRLGADINDVRRGIGHDSRIGFAFLFPGVGYGGSCFPKDVRALAAMADQLGVSPRILRVVDEVNEQQKEVLWDKIRTHFGTRMQGRTIALWGLAFKPRTDDIREAPSLVLIDHLLQVGCKVRVHDPEAMDNVRAIYGDKLTYCQRSMDAVEGADALAILTEWSEFRRPDFATLRELMKGPVIFDGRNLYEPERMRQAGFYYFSIGRSDVVPD